jgi:uncharacterized protein YjbJ (UPF0337 family)
MTIAKGTFLAPNRLSCGPTIVRRRSVDKEHIKGAADKAKGAVKDAFGKMTDDPSLQVEGKMDKAKGAAREALGDAKDAARRASKP